MIWCVLIGVFGAFGLLCALWALFGAYLTDPFGGIAVLHLTAKQIETALRRYEWLRNLGLIRARLVIVSALAPQEQQRLIVKYPHIDFLTLEQYLAQLEQEQKKGNGS